MTTVIKVDRRRLTSMHAANLKRKTLRKIKVVLSKSSHKKHRILKPSLGYGNVIYRMLRYSFGMHMPQTEHLPDN